MIRLIAACAAVIATPAMACVTADDLQTGIGVHYGEDGGEFHRRLEGGHVEVSARQGNSIVRWTLLNGLYYARMVENEYGKAPPKTTYTIDYPVGPAALPIPDKAGRWQMNTRLTLPPDPPIRQTEVFTASSPQVIRLDGCDYAAIRVRTETTSAGDVTTLTVLYLPELRTSLFLNVDDNPDRRPQRIVPLQPE